MATRILTEEFDYSSSHPSYPNPPQFRVTRQLIYRAFVARHPQAPNVAAAQTLGSNARAVAASPNRARIGRR
jgi:hypothetical protein